MWTFESLIDVERVLGPLTGPDRNVLTSGGVIFSHVTKPTTMDLMAGDSVNTVPASPTPANAPHYVSAGFTLTGIAPTAEAQPARGTRPRCPTTGGGLSAPSSDDGLGRVAQEDNRQSSSGMSRS